MEWIDCTSTPLTVPGSPIIAPSLGFLGRESDAGRSRRARLLRVWEKASSSGGRGQEDEMTDEYDLIVLGAGPVGENVADRAVQGGLTAVVVESELVGGECSYLSLIHL